MDRNQLVNVLRPRRSEDFVGNSGIMRIVERNLEKNRFAHLTIFSGTNGVGKSSLAEFIGMSLTCEENTKIAATAANNTLATIYKVDPCCKCQSCLNVLNSNMEHGAMKKFDMAMICNKREIIDVLKEIFVFEGTALNNVYILEEFQSLNPSEQEVFLEYLTRVPEDVYIFICTDRVDKLIPAIRSRFTQIPLEKPTLAEATNFTIKSAVSSGLKQPTKEVAKIFAKSNKCNPREIVTGLELFIPMGELKLDAVKDLYKVQGNIAESLWKSLFNVEIPTDVYLIELTKAFESADLLRVYEELHLLSINYLMESEVVIKDTELSTVAKGEIKKIIKGAGKAYAKVLELFLTQPATAVDALNILTRAKLMTQITNVPENNSLGTAKARSMNAGSFASKYGK